MEDFPRIRLDLQQKTPLTEQIRRAIFALIERRELEPGRLLPTVRQLALQLGVNFNTVARAYRALDAAGVITTRQGRGTYVVGLPGDMQEAQKESTPTVKERIERFIQEAEKDGITRQEIAQAVLLLTLSERKHEKIQLRYRIAKKKEARKEMPNSEMETRPNPRIRTARITRRKPGHAILFHVKQKQKKAR